MTPTTATMTATPSVAKSSSTMANAPSVKSPVSPAYGTSARKPSPPKIMIKMAVIVMPEYKNIRPPDTPVVTWAVIIVITRSGVIALTRASSQHPQEHQPYPQSRPAPWKASPN